MSSLIEIVNIHFFAFVLAVIGYVYSQILTQPGMILNGVWLWMSNRLPEWLFKPFIDCYLCVCGQMALWTGLYFVNYSRPVIEVVMLHVYYICLTILLSTIVNKIYESTKNN